MELSPSDPTSPCSGTREGSASPSSPKELCSHARDFKSAVWFGEAYRFNAQQAACLQVLWRAWLSGTPIIREELVLELARVKARSLKDVFKAPPGQAAWGTMISAGDRRGTVRLQERAEVRSRNSEVGKAEA
jgi:hypothetical protein